MDEKQRRWTNLLTIIGIFVVVTIFYVVNPSTTVDLKVEDDTLIIEGTEDFRCQVAVDDIESLEFVENADYVPDEQEGQKVLCGTFASDSWGEHYLCVYADVRACMVAYADTGTYVFNCDSADTTKAFYEALLEIL